MSYREYDYPGIRPGHPEYLPAAPFVPYCDDESQPYPYFRCTRHPGHEGDHAAHGDSDAQYARWPQAPNPHDPT